MIATPWADLFIEHGGGAPDGERAPLQADLAEVVAAAQPAPGVAVPAAALVTELARRAAASEPWRLEGEAARELGLACACVAGDRAGLRHLDAHYLSIVAPAVAHTGLDAATVDEIRQAVRHKLLVPGTDDEVKLLRYAGRGSLRGLVKVVAVRTALDHLRRARGEPAASDDLERLASPAESPELGVLKAHYRQAFRAAFARAVQALPRRDRNILRLHVLGGMTLDAVARMYGVHRSTVVRGLARTRKALFSATREALRADLKIDRDEFDSVMGLIRSRLEVSLGRLLQTVSPLDEG